MKAMILREDPAMAVQTSQVLAAKGFQTVCITSREVGQAMVKADLIDLLVMDERIGFDLTHGLALSAERRNPYLSTIVLTDQGRDQTDDLFDLIPSLYALLGPALAPAQMAQMALAAVANLDEQARRIDARLAAEALDRQGEAADLLAWDLLGPEDIDGALMPVLPPRTAQMPVHHWGDFSDLRPHLPGLGAIGAKPVAAGPCR